MPENVIKARWQLDELARRKTLRIPLHMPMTRTLQECVNEKFTHLPEINQFVISTPLGHYKTKLLELGLDPKMVMYQVEGFMRYYANSHAFHNDNMRQIGTKMYDAMKYIASITINETYQPIFRETFPIG